LARFKTKLLAHHPWRPVSRRIGSSWPSSFRDKIAVALAALVTGPALAQTGAPLIGPNAQASQAFGAVTPFGSPTQRGMSPTREAGVRECSAMASRYADKDSNMPIMQFRMCMAQHGQPE
jgi:hypothetical protein